jgi:NadR type nicotinamide-nucleotide adenylyltransferase
VFTSESYGSGFAVELTDHYRQKEPAYSTIEHVSVDQERQTLPISGTRLRGDVHNLKQWLSPRVYASFVQRICFLGGESSGKSSLARVLAEHYKTAFVPEYGRQLWEEKQGLLIYDDLLFIAKRQVTLEEHIAERAERYLFCDTSPLTTLSYCRDLFGQAPPELEALASRPYDLVVLCAPDFPFVQDGTRRDPSFRLKQHEWYLRELTERKIAYTLATGSIAERVQQIGKKLHSECKDSK